MDGGPCADYVKRADKKNEMALQRAVRKGAEMEKVRITFKNGLKIEAEVNGSSLITDSRPEFPSDLSAVTVAGADGERIYRDAEIIECASVDSRYWFSFREVPETERTTRQMQANIEYIAMMTDVDLEEV